MEGHVSTHPDPTTVAVRLAGQAPTVLRVSINLFCFQSTVVVININVKID